MLGLVRVCGVGRVLLLVGYGGPTGHQPHQDPHKTETDRDVWVMASEWMVVLTGRYQSLDRCPDHVYYFGFERAHNDAPTSWGEFFALGIKPEEPPQLVDFPTRAHTPQPPYPRAGCPETPSLPNCPLSPSHGRVLRCPQRGRARLDPASASDDFRAASFGRKHPRTRPPNR